MREIRQRALRPFKTYSIWLLLLIVVVACGTASADLTSYIDDHNRFILNGEPFFPLGLYVVECTNGSYAAELDEIADSPFNTLMNYAVNQCGTDATDAQILGYLDQLASRNLRLIFSLSEFFDGGQADIDTITHKVSTFKTHPAVISWYLNDERDPSVYLTQLEERYQKIRDLDENHPVWSVHWWPDDMLAEAHTTGIVGIDSYPIDNLPITVVADFADTAMQAGKPLWFVPQIFNWQDYPWDFRAATGRPPTREEMRAMTYLAANHGAKGLIYYSYFNIRDDADYAARWPQIKEIAREIDQLRAVFLSIDQTDPNDIVCNNPNIDIKLMRQGATYYLFAVNTKEEPVSGVSLQINLAQAPSMLDTLFEGDRQLGVSDGQFTDTFGLYEVHVYRWKTGSPFIDRLKPRRRLRGQRMTIVGANFGRDVGDGEVRIGRRRHYEDQALSRGRRLDSVKLWSPAEIRVVLSKSAVPKKWEGTKKYVWIEKEGEKSNCKKVTILAPES
jgi:hypothetical protein